VQEVIPVSNNCAVKLTTSLYYLPDETTIQGVGIEPDFVIEKTYPPTKQVTWFTANYGREKAYSNHIRAREKDPKDKDQDKKDGKKDDTKKRWIDRAKTMVQTDNQLRETISLINLLNTAYTHCPDGVCNRDKAISFLKKNHLTNDEIVIEEVK
jgi:carboxyl-terminal processing protease